MTKRTNLLKSDKFKIGGYARSRHFGTRIYKVLAVEDTGEQLLGFIGGRYRECGEPKIDLTLMKIGETNKGNFKFTNSKPFKTTAQWAYYPALGV